MKTNRGLTEVKPVPAQALPGREAWPSLAPFPPDKLLAYKLAGYRERGRYYCATSAAADLPEIDSGCGPEHAEPVA